MNSGRQLRYARYLLAAVVAAMTGFGGAALRAEPLVVSIVLEIDQGMGSDVPVSAPITLPRQLRGISPDLILATVHPADKPDAATVGQIVPVTGGGVELWWIVSDALTATHHWQARLTIGQTPSDERFSWVGVPGQSLDLLFAGRPITRYMYAADTSTQQRAFETFKVFHHVFDITGDDFITNGPGGLFPHHRGIFFGFNHLHYDGDRRDDWWHMSGGVTQRHQSFQELIAGPVLARSSAMITWEDSEGLPVVVERRTLTAYRQPSPTAALLDFESELTAVRSDIRLAGDPEHAGVQFRAHNFVAENTKDQTVYVFDNPDADATKDRDMPWAAIRYYMHDRQPYTVQQMNHLANPPGTLFSAYRDYGRFGAFFVTDVAKNQALTVRYRFWIANTKMPDRGTLRQRWNAYESVIR